MSVMMIAREPGTRKLRLSSSSLYQKRGTTLVKGSPLRSLLMDSWRSQFCHAEDT